MPKLRILLVDDHALVRAGMRSLLHDIADIEVVAEASDGAGFDVASAQRRAAAGESLGVVSMEERVALAGGSFQIHSAPGQGTVVVASFPVGAG